MLDSSGRDMLDSSGREVAESSEREMLGKSNGEITFQDGSLKERSDEVGGMGPAVIRACRRSGPLSRRRGTDANLEMLQIC